MSKNRPGSFRRLRFKYIKRRRPADGDYTCDYCGVSLVQGVHPPIDNSLTVDHIVPVSKGGALKDFNNMCICCWTCNNNKGSTIKKENE